MVQVPDKGFLIFCVMLLDLHHTSVIVIVSSLSLSAHFNVNNIL